MDGWDDSFASALESANQSLWSPLDYYLWHTCDIVADAVEGRLDQRPLVPTRTRVDQGDRALAVGPCQRMSWRALGNGSYVHTDFFVWGSPVVAVTGLFASSMANSQARRQAAFNAQPRWALDGSGEITVTGWKLYFAHPQMWADVGWHGLDTIDLVASDAVQISFVNTHGNLLTLVLRTPWASLIFALAARAAFPAHPRLLSGTWLPPDFERYCADMGHPCRPARRLAQGNGSP